MGAIAADLGERAGVVLEPWQRDGLDMLLSTRDDGKWACYEYAELCSRRNGKTAMLLVRALCGFLLLGETPVLWTAQEVKTSMRAWRDFRSMLWRLAGPNGRINDHLVDLGEGVLVRINASNGKEGFERVDTGQELKMVARSKDSGRGFDADFLVIDEAYDFTAEQQDALAPTQMARSNPQIAYASSPPLKGSASEALYGLRERAEGGKSARLGWRDWGRAESLDAVAALPEDHRRAFLDDPAVWASANPALNRGRVTAETVRNMRDAMTDAGFAREVLGCWPVQAATGGLWQVIAEDDWIGRAGGDKDLWTDDVAFAVASPFEQDWTAIAVAGWSTDGEILVQVVRYARGTAWVEDEILALTERHPGAVVALDPRGPAGHLRKPLQDADVELLEPTALDSAHAAQQFVRHIVDVPTVRHFGQDSLDIAVKAAVKRTQGDGWRWERRAGTDISPLDAASLAVWAVQDGGPALEPVSVGGGSADLATDDLSRIGF